MFFDPISTYLFALALEILFLLIKPNSNKKHFEIFFIIAIFTQHMLTAQPFCERLEIY